MADTATATKPAAKAEGKAKSSKPRPVAAVDTLDFDDAMDPTTIVAPVRQSKYVTLCRSLYDATAAGKVGRGTDGKFKMVKLGEFGNQNGARTQARALVPKLGETFEFKSTANGKGGSILWARVKEVAKTTEAPTSKAA